MKKKFFAIFLLVTIVGYASENNDVKESECIEISTYTKPCSVKVSFITPEGQAGSETFPSDSDLSAIDCVNFSKSTIADLKEKGYKIIEYSTIWQ